MKSAEKIYQRILRRKPQEELVEQVLRLEAELARERERSSARLAEVEEARLAYAKREGELLVASSK